ncbi:hypothetical protein [Streptomyces lancefieldiae]|uniref:Uncharacterized protein n=1 Tax=Streptomyces lancefieldiae TaxID=3075520 RepID=A0ABU3B104_9ACTN|nr:hypothetical protein [Streptomyces sp. DSM 40712]MDT0616132.1 hypothetical protein [Streptomyces sp. DSM 40712]
MEGLRKGVEGRPCYEEGGTEGESSRWPVRFVRFTENILTEDQGDVADVLRQLEAAGMRQAMEAHPAHRTTA